VTASARSTVTRAFVGLAVFVAFALATIFATRPDVASHRRGALISAAHAARTITHFAGSPFRELRTSKPAKLPAVAHAIKRTTERLGPGQSLGPALPHHWNEHAIAAAHLESILAEDAVTDVSRRLLASERHRARAPPLFI
jgi:hypothetical protein